METNTYILRVETGSYRVSMMVGSRWRLSYTPWEWKPAVTWSV